MGRSPPPLKLRPCHPILLAAPVWEFLRLQKKHFTINIIVIFTHLLHSCFSVKMGIHTFFISLFISEKFSSSKWKYIGKYCFFKDEHLLKWRMSLKIHLYTNIKLYKNDIYIIFYIKFVAHKFAVLVNCNFLLLN